LKKKDDNNNAGRTDTVVPWALEGKDDNNNAARSIDTQRPSVDSSKDPKATIDLGGIL
jgi:hypothetical protein